MGNLRRILLRLLRLLNRALGVINVAITSRSRLAQEGFSHPIAQHYESLSSDRTMIDDFEKVFESWELEKERGSLWQSPRIWFAGNEALWNDFVDHVKERKCLEIGSGPFGYLAPCYWIEDRVIVDPLINHYRDFQLRHFGKTFFVDEIKTHALVAEVTLNELVGQVDGFIVCQNTLDHCEDPLAILDNISSYACPGAYLLFSSDLWHLRGTDEGHRNITRSVPLMDRLLQAMGFEILVSDIKFRNSPDYLEYGRVARKK